MVRVTDTENSGPSPLGCLKVQRRRSFEGLFAMGLALALLTVSAEAQQEYVVDQGPRMASRTQLQAMVDSLEIVAASTESRERQRRVTDQIQTIRYRLEQGDVFPGDVVVLEVRDQQQWTDSFTVTPQRTLELPNLNEPVPIAGALYSEVEERIARELGRYLQEPIVSADVMKRVAVLGAVGKPGFYHIEGSALVSEAVMTAGGPAGNAKLRKVRIRRDDERIAEGFPRIAFQNLSLDQLGVRSGDELFVPRGGGSPWRITLGVLSGISSLIFLVTRF